MPAKKPNLNFRISADAALEEVLVDVRALISYHLESDSSGDTDGQVATKLVGKDSSLFQVLDNGTVTFAEGISRSAIEEGGHGKGKGSTRLELKYKTQGKGGAEKESFDISFELSIKCWYL